MPGPLEGFKVIECANFVTGPLAAMQLADQGADVVKVEPTVGGDSMRGLGSGRNGMGSFFASSNRSKRSLGLDLTTARGRELLIDLVRDADVFIQNYRPGVAERLGIGPDLLRSANPRLIYVSISGFGNKGPWSDLPAYDPIIQAIVGAAEVQSLDGGETPTFIRTALIDKITAQNAAQAVTAALLARTRSGEGQYVEISMLESALAFMWPDAMMNQMLLDDDVDRLPPLANIYQFYSTRDGHVTIAAVTPKQFSGMLRGLDLEELLDDPRFKNPQERFRNIELLRAEVAKVAGGMTSEELMHCLHAEDVPCAAHVPLDEIHTHEQVEALDCLVESSHPLLGQIREPRPVARFAGTPSEIQRPAPQHGEHSAELMEALGLSADQVGDLYAEGVIS
jgi:crotonobetainyl-CoA:carnitine CoA-transferase CaiB-like acyl-CoA transferase